MLPVLKSRPVHQFWYQARSLFPAKTQDNSAHHQSPSNSYIWQIIGHCFVVLFMTDREQSSILKEWWKWADKTALSENHPNPEFSSLVLQRICWTNINPHWHMKEPLNVFSLYRRALYVKGNGYWFITFSLHCSAGICCLGVFFLFFAQRELHQTF